MIPLAKQASRLNARIDESIDGGYSHVRVYVPIVHALYQVHASFVVLEDAVEEIALFPIRPSNFRAKHVRAHTGTGSDDVIRAHVLIVFFIPVYAVRSVDTVVHDGCTSF